MVSSLSLALTLYFRERYWRYSRGLSDITKTGPVSCLHVPTGQQKKPYQTRASKRKLIQLYSASGLTVARASVTLESVQKRLEKK